MQTCTSTRAEACAWNSNTTSCVCSSNTRSPCILAECACTYPCIDVLRGLRLSPKRMQRYYFKHCVHYNAQTSTVCVHYCVYHLHRVHIVTICRPQVVV